MMQWCTRSPIMSRTTNVFFLLSFLLWWDDMGWLIWRASMFINLGITKQVWYVSNDKFKCSQSRTPCVKANLCFFNTASTVSHANFIRKNRNKTTKCCHCCGCCCVASTLYAYWCKIITSKLPNSIDFSCLRKFFAHPFGHTSHVNHDPIEPLIILSSSRVKVFFFCVFYGFSLFVAHF